MLRAASNNIFEIPEMTELTHVETPNTYIVIPPCSGGRGRRQAAILSSDTTSPTRYGLFSEEGRQTVATAIASALLETDLELEWEFPLSSSEGEGRGGRGRTDPRRRSRLTPAITAVIRGHRSRRR